MDRSRTGTDRYSSSFLSSVHPALAGRRGESLDDGRGGGAIRTTGCRRRLGTEGHRLVLPGLIQRLGGIVRLFPSNLLTDRGFVGPVWRERLNPMQDRRIGRQSAFESDPQESHDVDRLAEELPRFLEGLRREKLQEQRQEIRQFGSADFEAFRAVMPRSEEHTSELQSLMRISYAVFCLKKNKITT